VGDTV
jgi:hypothetical protein